MGYKQITIWVNRRIKKVITIVCGVAFFTFLGKVTENLLSGNGTNPNFLSELVRVATMFSQYIFIIMGIIGIIGFIIYMTIVLINRK